MIVITDGESAGNSPPGYAADEARAQGITLIAVGINDYNHEELLAITGGDQERVSEVEDFDALADRAEVVAQSVCYTDPLFCPLDILFVNDASSSIGHEDYQKSLDFMISTLGKLAYEINRGDVYVGVLTYDDVPEVVLPFGQYDYQDLAGKIRALQNSYDGGNTKIGRAITLGRQHYLERGRRGVESKMVVITDGISHDSVTEPSAAARSSGIELFAIGVAHYDIDQLNDIADSNQDNVVLVENYDALNDPLRTMIALNCDAPPEPPPEPCVNIMMDFDLMFVNDESRSIAKGNYPKSLNFMSEILKGFKKHIDDGSVRVGVLTYGKRSELRIPLGQYSFDSLSSNIKNLPYGNGATTMTGDAIERATEHVVSNSRSSRPRYMIVITDGESAAGYAVVPPGYAADEARAQGIQLMAVGINNYNMDELLEIAGGDQKAVKEVDDFDALAGLAKEVSQTICARASKNA